MTICFSQMVFCNSVMQIYLEKKKTNNQKTKKNSLDNLLVLHTMPFAASRLEINYTCNLLLSNTYLKAKNTILVGK